jgi:hypothetical protein
LLHSYLRGEGTFPRFCEECEEESGGLCFPKCKKGYSGAGPICLQNCPPGYTDTGDFCQKPEPYGRGPGYLLSEKEKCLEESPTRKCEFFGQFYYPKCKPGFHPIGCCVCAPDCIDDIKRGFKKRTYGRGPGKLLNCKCGEEFQNGLCYPRCKKGYIGIGSVCWAQCPRGLQQCGLFCIPKNIMCLKKTECVLTNIGHLIHGLIPEHHDGELVEFEHHDLSKRANGECKKEKKCKKSEIIKLVGFIPGCKEGRHCKLPICHHREHRKESCKKEGCKKTCTTCGAKTAPAAKKIAKVPAAKKTVKVATPAVKAARLSPKWAY